MLSSVFLYYSLLAAVKSILLLWLVSYYVTPILWDVREETTLEIQKQI